MEERAVRFLRVRKSAGLDEVAEWETDVFLESPRFRCRRAG
jgi:hypothetical protein